MSLSLNSVTAGYGETQVLQDVTIVVPDRAVVALLGANGAGKTTTLRVASGQVRPTGGAVTVDGTDLTGANSDRFAACEVALMPEGRGVFPNLTVRENISLFAPPGQGEAAIEIATAALPPLQQRLNQSAGTMSGGEQQMLALSRAYVRPVRTLLVDEVSMGLAPVVVDAIYEALRVLAERGVALLLVEQFAAKALAIADYVYLLAKGRVVFAGEPCEVRDEALASSYLGSAH